MDDLFSGSDVINRPKEVDEQKIRKVYDLCNELFRGKKECFYTLEETKEWRD